MERAVRVEIDEMPLAMHQRGILDYMGRVVGAAGIEPLLRFDDRNSQACSNVIEAKESEVGALHHKFRVADRFRWSDGRWLTADDVARRLIRVKEEHPYWAHHLRWIDKIETCGDILTIDLRRPVNYLEKLLCADELAPVSNEPWQPGSEGIGPYVLKRIDTKRNLLRFSPNPFSSGSSLRPDLEFALQQDLGRVTRGFLTREVDVTCSTMFPCSSIAEWSGTAAFRSAPSPIWMQIEFGPNIDPLLMRGDVRTALSAALDRNELSLLLSRGLKPRQSVLATTEAKRIQPVAGAANETANKRIGESRSPLRLAFSDYYPNREVAEAVQKSWADKLGFHIALVVSPFEAPTGIAADMRLQLRYPSFPDPVAELEAAMIMLARLGSEDEKRRAATLATELRHGTSGESEDCLAELVDLLDRASVVIPLLQLHHHWLQRPNVSGFSYPYLANFDYRQLSLDGCQQGY